MVTDRVAETDDHRKNLAYVTPPAIMIAPTTNKPNGTPVSDVGTEAFVVAAAVVGMEDAAAEELPLDVELEDVSGHW